MRCIRICWKNEYPPSTELGGWTVDGRDATEAEVRLLQDTAAVEWE